MAAVFLLNDCNYPNCGLRFRNGQELIIHIEIVHHRIKEQKDTEVEFHKATSVPMSYVLPFCSDSTETAPPAQADTPPIHRVEATMYPFLDGNCDDEEEYIEDSYNDDAWITKGVYSFNYIYHNGRKKKNMLDAERPFVCIVPNCNKTYKNDNGLKYHAKYAHKKGFRVRKIRTCKCGFQYHIAVEYRHHAAEQRRLRSLANANFIHESVSIPTIPNRSTKEVEDRNLLDHNNSESTSFDYSESKDSFEADENEEKIEIEPYVPFICRVN